MEIIKKGKYTDKEYKCKNKDCGCTFKIDYMDICSDTYTTIGCREIIILYIECPECRQKIKLGETDYNG